MIYDIIILIIASDFPDHYMQMQIIWKKYMNTHPRIKAYFIKGKMPNQNDDIYVNDIYVDNETNTIYSNCEESTVPGILIKTIKSIEYIYNNYDFKYIYRTNLSSFLNLNKMHEYAMANDFDYGALRGFCLNIYYGAGCGFFISKKICNFIINNKNKIDYKIHDDVSIGLLLNHETNVFPVPRMDLIFDQIDIQKIITDKTTFHYRCKHINNTNISIKTLNTLYDIFYQSN
jgi:hypothetical protein